MRSSGWAGSSTRACVTGAMGLSVNHSTRIGLRLVPDLRDRCGVPGVVRCRGAVIRPATVQMITRFNDRDHDIRAERFGRLCREAGVRAQWPGIPIERP